MSLDVKNITFRYGKKEPAVLEAFSAVFEKGVITAVLGPNGAGKTTLSKIIMGILTPERGSLLLDGCDMKGWSLAERGKKIGYVMQNPDRQLFSLTVWEEMEYGLVNQGLKGDPLKEKCRRFLELFDLTGYEESFPFHLSHGEKQRLVLAAVLAMEPEYLILDEPTSSLDQKRRARLGQYLRTAQEELGCGILLISHDQRFVDQYAQKQIQLGGGENASSEQS